MICHHCAALNSDHVHFISILIINGFPYRPVGLTLCLFTTVGVSPKNTTACGVSKQIIDPRGIRSVQDDGKVKDRQTEIEKITE